MNMKLLRYWGPAVVWMSLIFFLSSRTRVKVSDVFEVQFLIFKSLHVIEYATLYVLTYRALRNTSASPDWENRYNAFLIAALYGALDEIHQMFVPTREGRMRDVVIDAFGAGLAAWYLWRLLPKMPKKLKVWAKKLAIL